MLLHWATNCHMTHQKREAARAMVNDLLDRNLGAVDDTDAMWHAFRSFISENKLDVLLVEKPASSKKREKSIVGNTSLCEMITTSCMYLFANRKKCQELHACLVKHLKILETRINEIILKGMVGDEDISEKKQTPTLTRETNKNLLQESSSSSLTWKPTKTNLVSARVRKETTGNKQNMARMMKSKRVLLHEEKMTNKANKKQKNQNIENEKE